MEVFHTVSEFKSWRRALPPETRVPFAPTMGALHEGHASLVRQAQLLAADSGKVVSSIFVNPTQFGPQEDFAKYPRTLEADLAALNAAGCDAVFVPSAQEMYPSLATAGTNTLAGGVSIDAGPLGKVLEGAARPGHFNGVCTIVFKLLNIVQPTELLLGQKDFQQQAVLRRMCADLDLQIKVITCPTVREPDGLAMSSRNRYLSAEDRMRAVGIFQAMSRAQSQYAAGERSAVVLEATMRIWLSHRELATQYAVVAHPETLDLWSIQPARLITGPAVLLVAAKLGQTRLIDNMRLAAAEEAAR